MSVKMNEIQNMNNDIQNMNNDIQNMTGELTKFNQEISNIDVNIPKVSPEYISLLGEVTPPKYIEYSSEIGKSPQNVPLANFFKESDKNIKGYAGTYYIKKNELKQFQEYCATKITQNPFNINDMSKGIFHIEKIMSSKELRTKSQETSEKIRIAKVNEEVNNSAFSKTHIKKGSLICYGGEIRFINYKFKKEGNENNHNNLYLMVIGTKDKNGFVVDSKEYRDFSAYFAHLINESQFDQHFQLAHPSLISYIAFANFTITYCFLSDLKVIVNVLKATRDIKPNEILGIDYSEDDYFNIGLKKQSQLLFHTGHPFPRSLYISPYFYLKVHTDGELVLENPKSIWENMSQSLDNNIMNIFTCEKLAAFFDEPSSKKIKQFYGKRFFDLIPDGVLDLNIMKQIIEKILIGFNNCFGENKIPLGLWDIDFNKGLLLKIEINDEIKSVLIKNFTEMGILNFISINKALHKNKKINVLNVRIEECCRLALHYNLINREALSKLKDKETVFEPKDEFVGFINPILNSFSKIRSLTDVSDISIAKSSDAKLLNNQPAQSRHFNDG